MASVKKRKSKDGTISYNIRVFMGTDSSGKQQCKYVTYNPDPAVYTTTHKRDIAAKAYAEQLELQFKQGYKPDNKMTFAIYSGRVLGISIANNTIRYSTTTGYKEKLVRINNSIGNYKLSEITPALLNTFFTDLMKPGNRKANKHACCKVDFKAKLAELINPDINKPFTQQAFSDKYNISLAVIKQCIHQNSIMYDKAETISAAFGVPVENMFQITVDNRPLSAKTVREHKNIISKVMSQAVIEGYVLKNPVEDIKPLFDKSKQNIFIEDNAEKDSESCETSDSRFLSEEDLRKITEAFNSIGIDDTEDDNYKYKLMVTLLLMTGLRRGELVALRKSNIRFEDGKAILNIDKAIGYRKDVGMYITAPKSKSSKRKIIVAGTAAYMLKAWTDEVTINHKALHGTRWPEYIYLPTEDTIRDASDDNGNLSEVPKTKPFKADFIFCRYYDMNKLGYPMHPDSVTGWCEKFGNKLGIKNLHPHAFRHTMASAMVASGTDIATVSHRLGHSDISVTERVYTHTYDSSAEKAAADLEKNISKLMGMEPDDSPAIISEEKDERSEKEKGWDALMAIINQKCSGKVDESDMHMLIDMINSDKSRKEI